VRNLSPRSVRHQPRLGDVHHTPTDRDPPLTAGERLRVALAGLVLIEREHELRLVQLRAERRMLLARAKGAR
jgi:hypothetical protein